MNMIAVVVGIIGVSAGFVLGWALMAKKALALKVALAQKTSELEAEKRIGAEREQKLQQQMKGMLAELTNVTAEVLAKREQALAVKNEEQVRNLLAPMHQRLDDFRKAAEESKKTSGELGVRIGEFLTGIKGASQELLTGAKSFSEMLAGANKKQGDWGEAVLGQALENCGLKKDVHYVAQQGSGEGIPDYQVFDPGSKKVLIIDAKMSWTKYEQAYKMPHGEERRRALQEHVKSVKGQIDKIYKADYPNRQQPLREGYAFVPLTAMFVPSDAALAAAIEEDAGLVDYAFKRNVALVSPLTLYGFLQLVSRAWANYHIEKNTNEIFDEAKKLVKYVDRLFVSLQGLGKSLSSAKDSYDEAMKLAATDPEGQCVKGPALKILKLGAKPDTLIKSQSLNE